MVAAGFCCELIEEGLQEGRLPRLLLAQAMGFPIEVSKLGCRQAAACSVCTNMVCGRAACQVRPGPSHRLPSPPSVPHPLLQVSCLLLLVALALQSSNGLAPPAAFAYTIAQLLRLALEAYKGSKASAGGGAWGGGRASR